MPNLAEALAVAASVLVVLAGLSRTESEVSESSDRSDIPRVPSEATHRDDDQLKTPSQPARGSDSGSVSA